MAESPDIEPRLSPAEREELAHIAYLVAQMEALYARHLVPPASHEIILAEYTTRGQSIERRGKAAAALFNAHRLLLQQPEEALLWAERARQLDPDCEESWTLAIDLHARLHRYEEALALGDAAVPRFPPLAGKLLDLQRAREEHDAGFRREAEQQREQRVIAECLTEARKAWREGRYDDVLGLCQRVRERQPDHREALTLLVATYERLGLLEAAISFCRELERVVPDYAAWTMRLRRALQARTAAPAPQAAPLSQQQETRIPPAPAMSWSAIAGEFLQTHWQKLLLCLAALLIVVSSTVGAHNLLGPLLWSPEGKCLLALAYTILAAAFGAGLLRWGAAGAGRGMILTALIVVPVNFALAGELQLLFHPSPWRLLVAALDAAALLFLCGRIAAESAPGGGGFLTLGFFTLSALNAVLARGASPGGGFAALLLLASVFLIAVWRINTRWIAARPEHRDAAYLALGLLAYAFLFGIARTGVVVLGLAPTLYALPVMLAAIAGVHTAHHLLGAGEDARRVHLLRYSGYLLAGTAFALALARPPDPSALFSGSTLATAVVGLGLFAVSLALYRQPVYLYCAAGALFVAYFGAGYFVGDVMAAIEDTARRALGYEQRLPIPFKALNGIVFNSILALLALHFTRHWKDERLTRHCHAMGLPLSLAACSLSCCEPKAAALCLPAYAALYAIGAGLFAQPLLIYLACAAFAGGAFFAATLLPGLSLGAWALGAAGVGFAFWLAWSMLAHCRTGEAYRGPLVHATLALVAAALAAATLSVLPPRPISLAAVLTFFVAAVLTGRVNAAYPRPSLAYLVLIPANLGYLVAVAYARLRLGLPVSAAGLGIAAGASSVALAALGGWLRHTSERNCPAAGARRAGGGALCLYMFPLFHLALAQAALGAMLGAAQVLGRPAGAPGLPLPGDAALLAITLGLGTVTLALVTAFAYPTAALAALTVATGAAAWGMGLFSSLLALEIHPLAAALAVAAGASALLLHLAGAWLAPSPRGSASGAPHAGPVATLYRDPLLSAALVAVGVSWLLCSAAWHSYALVAVALALTAATLAASTRFRREVTLVYLSLASAITAALFFTASCVDGSHSLVNVGPGWLALTTAAASLALWSAGRFCQHRGVDRFYTAPCFEVALVAASGVFVLAGAGGLAWPVGVPLSVAALFLTTLVYLLLTTVWRAQALVYAAIVAFVSATHLALLPGSQVLGAIAGVPLLLTAAMALALWVGGFLCQRLLIRSAAKVGGNCGALIHQGLAPEGLDESRPHPHSERGATYVCPQFVSSLVLTLAAVALGFHSPAVLLLAAIAFLLMVKSFPAAEWLYAALGAGGGAIYLAFLAGPPDERLVKASVAAAFALWLLGVLVQRLKPALCARLQLPALGYEFPLFNTALAASLLALALRVGGSVQQGHPWTAHVALLPVLAVFSLLMLKAYAHRGWVHASTALFTLAIVAEVAPLLAAPPGEPAGSPLPWLLVGMALANLWLLAQRGLARIQEPLCRCLGVREDRYAHVLGVWSLALFATTATWASMVVAGTAGVTAFSLGPVETGGGNGWWSLLLALALAAAYLALHAHSLGSSRLQMGLGGVLLLAVWWLGAPASPLVRVWDISAPAYYPVVTAGTALAGVLIGWRGGGDWLFRAGLALTAAALAFTQGSVTLATAITLLLATAAFGVLTAWRGRVAFAYAGSITFAATCLYGVLVVAGSGIAGGTERANAVALGAVAAAFALLTLAGWLRQEQSAAPATQAPRKPARRRAHVP